MLIRLTGKETEAQGAKAATVTGRVRGTRRGGCTISKVSAGPLTQKAGGNASHSAGEEAKHEGGGPTGSYHTSGHTSA